MVIGRRHECAHDCAHDPVLVETLMEVRSLRQTIEGTGASGDYSVLGHQVELEERLERVEVTLDELKTIRSLLWRSLAVLAGALAIAASTATVIRAVRLKWW